jgi:hypothetical protein
MDCVVTSLSPRHGQFGGRAPLANRDWNIAHQRTQTTIFTITSATMDDTPGRIEMAKAFHLAARKVEKKPKVETKTEMHQRTTAEKEAKTNRCVKKAAKTMLKKKKIKKLTTCFSKK